MPKRQPLIPQTKQWWVAFPLLPLTLLLADPVRRPKGPYDLPLSVLGLALFVALLGWSMSGWKRGRTGHWQLAGMVLICLAFAPLNSMVWVMFLTVICLTPWSADGNARETVLLTVLIVGALALETLVLEMPWRLVQSVAIYAVPDAVVSFMLRKQVHNVAMLTRYEERDRIARDMHDVLGHTLSVIILKAELAVRLAPQNPERVASEVRDIEVSARALLHEVRETISGYRSADLNQALQQARNTLEAAGVHVSTHCQQISLPAQLATVLSLALREAVTNILRHAKARHCTLALTGNHNTLVLTVEDDGTWQADAGEGDGLRGMRERVTSLGGKLQLTHHAGTRLRIEMPITPTQISG